MTSVSLSSRKTLSATTEATTMAAVADHTFEMTTPYQRAESRSKHSITMAQQGLQKTLIFFVIGALSFLTTASHAFFATTTRRCAFSSSSMMKSTRR